MKSPLVSILIPFKNTELFLLECLNSIINQSYTNWELLIVDDNSSDKSYSIAASCAAEDDRIILLKNSGFGIIDALATAFSHSKGDYITRMDSDDIMHLDKLKFMAKDLQEHGLGHIALGLVKYFCANGVGEGFARYETWLNSLTTQGSNFSEIYKECVIPSPCWMVHREDLIKSEAFVPNRYPEDYDLAFRFKKHGLKCIPSQKILLYWRDYTTRTSRTHEHYAQNHFLDIKLHYFLESDFNNSRPLAIWGAGTKGKHIAKLLIEKKIQFYWICDNPKKIGKDIYEKRLLPFNYLEQLEDPQSIITVANEDAQSEITQYFHSYNMVSMQDYFFFC
ncbi:glycosyltransferase family 2 protein [Ichthyenterobacterium sp. W332]|uniref:Glycosyltransferase family 2 protein n=1 Tax=Microcosmobacter mediterraneus TaxID=3075607 RepID=A0ABU2YKM3_9FLAO|nr:glycosyltransferase family 2 protein [Ichthyenterobacterium sp. W332]MDT0558709.1 glycosyltransferase family 2 protein [Ichthyenterobacterium sp. W332]